MQIHTLRKKKKNKHFSGEMMPIQNDGKEEKTNT